MTDHAKNIEYWADAGIVENTNETAMTIQGARDLRRLELYAAADELRRLQAENASLWALAKFGREMLNARNLSPIPLSDAQMAGLRAVINDLAELCDLLEIDPNSEILVETPLAQLPEKQ